MIESFQISNFKGFNEPLKIDIAPITLVFGPNSAGKSSIIEGLQMIKHSGPNDLQTFIENRLDLGRSDEILSRQNKRINPNIAYFFSFRYSGLNKPKGPLLDKLERIGVKKNFMLTKDNSFENNQTSVLLDGKFFFSIKLGIKTHSPVDVKKLENTLGGIDLNDLDKIKQSKMTELIKAIDQVPDGDPYWKTKKDLVFTVDTISDDEQFWENIVSYFATPEKGNRLRELANKINFVYSQRMRGSKDSTQERDILNKEIKNLKNMLNNARAYKEQISPDIKKIIDDKKLFSKLPHKDSIFKLLIENKSIYLKTASIIKLLKDTTFFSDNDEITMWEELQEEYSGLGQSGREEDEYQLITLVMTDINNSIKNIFGYDLIKKVKYKNTFEYKFDDKELADEQLQDIEKTTIDKVYELERKIEDIDYSVASSHDDSFRGFSTKKLRDFLDYFIRLADKFEFIKTDEARKNKKKNDSDFLALCKEIKTTIRQDIIDNFIIDVEIKRSDSQRFAFHRKETTIIDLVKLSLETDNIYGTGLFPNLDDVLDHCDSLIEECLANFSFVPCFRSYERIYRSTRRSMTAPLDISNSTADLVEILSRDTGLLKDLNDWLKQSTLNSEILVEEDSDTRTMYMIEGETDLKINIADAGSGIRNLIPIIAVALHSTKQLHPYRRHGMETVPIIALEEPEVNLHPRLQIDLASFIADFSKKRNFLIETHSELIMRKIQQLIRDSKNSLTSNDVKVYCVRKNQEGHYVDEIRLDRNAKFLDEWPHGFFNERIDLI